MSDYPDSAAERAAIREGLRATLVAHAEREAAVQARSMKCNGWAGLSGTPLHRGDEDGCANDGRGCICRCHDDQRARP